MEEKKETSHYRILKLETCWILTFIGCGFIKAFLSKCCSATVLQVWIVSSRGAALIYLQDGYDDAEQADGAAKDLHDEDLHEQAGVLGVGQCCSAAHDAHADAAEEVGEAHSQAGSKHGVTWQDGNQPSQRPLSGKTKYRLQLSEFVLLILKVKFEASLISENSRMTVFYARHYEGVRKVYLIFKMYRALFI